ncbi:MAG: capsular biosynthesis protein [Sulfurimonas sp.]
MTKKLINTFKVTSDKSCGLLHTTDLHSHLIPNIDDGVKSLEESVHIIVQLKDLGFKKIIVTPHIMSHRFPNNKKSIYQGYLSLKNELIERKIDFDIKVAAEYYYDEHFLELIENKELLTFGDNYVLFECSYQLKPFALEQTVAKLRKAGYKAILAHPERYSYYNKKSDYLRLKKMGLLLQINAISMEGFYGKIIQKKVEKIVNLGIVDFIGSDIHSQMYVDSFSTHLKSKTYLKIFEKNKIQNDYL